LIVFSLEQVFCRGQPTQVQSKPNWSQEESEYAFKSTVITCVHVLQNSQETKQKYYFGGKLQ